MPTNRSGRRRAPALIATLIAAVALTALVAAVAYAGPAPAQKAATPSSSTSDAHAGPAPSYTGPDLAGALRVALWQSTAWYAAATAPPPPPPPPVAPPSTSGTVGSAAHGTPIAGFPCGGDLPPCWVLDRESGYNDGDPFTYDIHAYNPTGCGGRGCRGKWQCDPRSCSGTGSEAEQDAEARELWDGGAGCSNWGACR